MGAVHRLLYGRAAQLRIDQRVIHADLGEVTVTEIEGRHAHVRDEHGDTAWVPATEIT